MSAPTILTATTSLPRPSTPLQRFRERYGWVVAVTVLLVLMLLWRASQLPVFGGFALRTVTAGTLTLAFVAVALGVVVITGGFNFAVGSMVVFINCFSAWLMEGRGLGACLLIALLAIVVAVIVSALMGAISVISGVPDIVVTLAMSFVLPGASLLILGGPGGGTSPEFVSLVVGDFSNPWPSMAWLVAPLALVWLPLSRSRHGKALYAVGSDRKAAFLAGVDVGRTRILAYAVSGLFCGLAGVATTAYTASAEPRASIGLGLLLSAVAAVVVGGVALQGGVGGLVGPVLAALILSLIPAIMLGLGIDPNTAEIVRGAILITVVLIGSLFQTQRRHS